MPGADIPAPEHASQCRRETGPIPVHRVNAFPYGNSNHFHVEINSVSTWKCGRMAHLCARQTNIYKERADELND